ncbi:MAG: PrsW family intramembrane metalloprotease [Candidatus Thermoplasmatota archaeon]|jgi:RsiW-degrading membrane proteinase PrsW (M82 family)|nr:PrsW family intramembrane metalloprotease [Candidatus Thermoplasmatota archaeon]
MAFLPPIIYSIWIRNTEKYNKEKWRSIFLCFIWGATISILAAFILEYILHFSLTPSIDDQDYLNLMAVIVIAPFVEELTKPLALRSKIIKKEISEPEDGLIYGAVAGLGFSATENLVYGYSFLKEGFLIFIILISIRSVSACLLHASATAFTGYGYGKTIIKKTSIIRVLPYFLFATFLHSTYNSLLVFDVFGLSIGFIASILLSMFTIKIIRRKIRSLDKNI